ncbi:MAG TPA: hypothetical protein VGR41_04220 [Actinomycetota bacterium]|nr:hypothetical protein [Actinomycetota bacterium]
MTIDKGYRKMDNKEWQKVFDEAEDQGWVIDQTTEGFQLLAPNGKDIVTMHALHKSSSPYALAKTVSRMKEYGFRWPPPKKKKKK